MSAFDQKGRLKRRRSGDALARAEAQARADEPAPAEDATGFRIRRSDGTWAVNFTFETQEEAQEVCDSLFETRFPFAYAVVRVCQ